MPHLLGLFACGRPNLVTEAAITINEFRGELGERAGHVVVDQENLPVTVRRAADPDRRRRHDTGQLVSQALGNPIDILFRASRRLRIRD